MIFFTFVLLNIQYLFKGDMAETKTGKRHNRRIKSEVSCFIKYMVFGFNVFFWLLGIGVTAIGMWSWAEKDMFNNLSQLVSGGGFFVDPAMIMIVVGSVMFFIGFLGCIGALRENTCLLLMFSICLGVILFAELAIGILGFVYSDWMKEQIEIQLLKFIKFYRKDADLQNVMDWVQEKWLHCCGVREPSDWDDNMYFNCTSPSAEACGVPYSCCRLPDPLPPHFIVNKQCGYEIRDTKKFPNPEVSIYMTGCIDAGIAWLKANLELAAGIAVGIAVMQIVGICCAQNLRSDIYAQKEKWDRLKKMSQES